MPEQDAIAHEATPVATPEAEAAAPARRRARRGRTLAYWLVAGALYVGVGVFVPQLTFLGFQEAFLYVLAVTALAPVVIPRLP